MWGNHHMFSRVEKIEADSRNNVKVRVRWYYRSEESMGGRRQFHGTKELFLSDHHDVQSAHTIEGKCVVHSFKNYTKLENVGTDDYFCRFEYKATTVSFSPDRLLEDEGVKRGWFWECLLSYLIIGVDACRFHPSCMGMTIEEAKKLDHFLYSDCVAKDDPKKGGCTFSLSPLADGK
ncbi:Chromatin remodeling protein EBS, partial [Bienertia sinuspersici]